MLNPYINLDIIVYDTNAAPDIQANNHNMFCRVYSR